MDWERGIIGGGIAKRKAREVESSGGVSSDCRRVRPRRATPPEPVQAPSAEAAAAAAGVPADPPVVLVSVKDAMDVQGDHVAGDGDGAAIGQEMGHQALGGLLTYASRGVAMPENVRRSMLIALGRLPPALKARLGAQIRPLGAQGDVGWCAPPCDGRLR